MEKDWKYLKVYRTPMRFDKFEYYTMIFVHCDFFKLYYILEKMKFPFRYKERRCK